MSTSDLYILNGKSTSHLAEFRNGWGSAPVIWDHLGEKYVPERPTYSFDGGHLRKVWALAGDDRLASHEKICLMITFDKAYIPLANLTEAADACARMGAETSHMPGVNHWIGIGDELRKAAKQHFSRHARGIVLSPTSVSDCWGFPSNDWLKNAWPIFDLPAGEGE